ncbi:TlpA disulfide reductase family protein [Algoriphagus sp. NG3]|uniref:TlpA family protein disulfide reductase n=1 Tax=Algoriphagus sp. NG3 TaxID=3097546 RepID=UPI002A839652|nr:TlpA disulfide reductase family protein [Algoriphagus sp. NG3]WPR73744.1 TlpA disulfide reductase family protein [Algoriphagus sp. NG3]
MKKLVLLCFLGGVCLLGSKLKAQSGVAESPIVGADFLHRSQPHRGGETRSDTFLQQTNEAENYSSPFLSRGQSTVEGGPIILSSAYPWRVFGLSSQTGFSLADDSTSQGQGEGNTFAQVGRLHVELPFAIAPDTLSLTYWDNFLKEHTEVTPGVKIDLVAEKGTFFEGNAGYKVYRWDLPDMQAPLTFSIRNGSNHLFRYWTLLTGDQVKIRLDLNSGKSYFSGPSAPFFKAQYEVDRLAEEQRFNEMPLMVTGNPDRMLSDSLIAALYERSLQLPSELYNPMWFVVRGKTDAKLLEKYLAKPLVDYPMIAQLPHLTAELEAEDAELIRQKAYGTTLSLILSKIKLGRTLLKEDPHASQFRKLEASFPIPETGNYISAELLAALYDLTLLRGNLSGQSANKLLASYPSEISDRIMGLYLLDRFKRLESNQAEAVSQVLESVELPWVRELVLELQSKSLTGSPLQTSSLLDQEGNPFTLDQLKGKAVVLSFWISGCKFCVKYYQNALEPVFNQWRDHENVVFVSVNADPDQARWKEEVISGMYSHPDMIQLHQDAGSGILADYQISTFPQKLLVSPDYRLFQLTTTQYSADQLSEKITEMLELPSDSFSPKPRQQ